MRLSLAFSPCPNDTFAFHAMINHKVDTEGLEFDVYMGDVEDLNSKGKETVFDVSKFSYHAFFYLCENYIMLRSGSALGYDNGPLMVCREDVSVDLFKKRDAKINQTLFAVPGKWTTAALLLKIAYPEIIRTKDILFSDIAKAILDMTVDGGVIIHEGRFLYKEYGLCLIEDLGEYWSHISGGLPLPLGGIAVRKGLECAEKVNRVLRRSIEYAMRNPDESSKYISDNARELSLDVQRKHIEMFVNEDTINLSKEGENAVNKLYSYFLKFNTKYKKREILFI